jgi:hypothetical protein
MLCQEQFNDGNCHYNEARRHCPGTYIATTSHQCDGEFGKSNGEQKCNEVLSCEDRKNWLEGEENGYTYERCQYAAYYQAIRIECCGYQHTKTEH